MAQLLIITRLNREKTNGGIVSIIFPARLTVTNGVWTENPAGAEAVWGNTSAVLRSFGLTSPREADTNAHHGRPLSEQANGLWPRGNYQPLSDCQTLWWLCLNCWSVFYLVFLGLWDRWQTTKVNKNSREAELWEERKNWASLTEESGRRTLRKPQPSVPQLRSSQWGFPSRKMAAGCLWNRIITPLTPDLSSFEDRWVEKPWSCS